MSDTASSVAAPSGAPSGATAKPAWLQRVTPASGFILQGGPGALAASASALGLADPDASGRTKIGRAHV